MDMLIKLFEERSGEGASLRLPFDASLVVLRKPLGLEHTLISRWVADRFGTGWASEVQVALANRPVSVWIATRHDELVGFVCFDATARGFVGPIGVADTVRGRGLGAALLRACLQDMRAAGYGYAIAGSVGAPDFFRRVAGASEIAHSTPGIYAGQLKL